MQDRTAQLYTKKSFRVTLKAEKLAALNTKRTILKKINVSFIEDFCFGKYNVVLLKKTHLVYSDIHL